MAAGVGNPLFSIVMPVYGVERYIADAVADIIVQDCRDFELIVVDDCSPDRSIDVVRELAGDDPRVRIVRHEENRGLSQARNTGMRAACGTWVLFPDPDDRYERDMLSCVERIVSCEPVPDLVVFGHVQEYYDAAGAHLYDNPLPLEDGRTPAGPELGRLALSLEQRTHLGYAWNKAYRLELIRDAGLGFQDDVPLIEDILFNVAYLSLAREVAMVGAMPYRYAKRLAGNLTNEYVPNYFELHRRRIQEVRDLVEGFGALDDAAKSTLGALYARYILSALERNLDPRAQMGHAARLAWLHELFADGLFCELVDGAQAEDSKSLAASLVLLKSRNIPGLLALAHVIHAVRTRSTTVFTKARSGR